MMHQKHLYRIGLAGSTKFTTDFAKQLRSDNRFEVCWTLSPEVKIVGRKQKQVDNPLYLWSNDQNVPSVRITSKIDQMVKNEIERLKSDIDILLVVDYGYYVPQWLLDLPKVAPLNLHPSKLPEWRGSSPGQAVLLSGAQTSAITLMQMDGQLDHGPILHQDLFAVDPSWTQTEYYQVAFASIMSSVGDLIEQRIVGNLVQKTQPESSPTPLARELTKADGFLPWELVTDLMLGSNKLDKSTIFESQLPSFLAEMWRYLNAVSSSDVLSDLATLPPVVPNPIEFVARAARALSPWPQLWTLVPTTRGERRLKILSVDQTITNKLILTQVQLEGQHPALWNQIKNSILNQS